MNWVIESWVRVVIVETNMGTTRNHMEEKLVKLGKCLT